VGDAWLCVWGCARVIVRLCGCVTVPRPAVSPPREFTPRTLQGVAGVDGCPYPSACLPAPGAGCLGVPGVTQAPGSCRHPLLQHHPAPPSCLVWTRGGLWLLGLRRRVALRKHQGPEATLSRGSGPLAVIHRGLALPGAQAVGGLQIWVGGSAQALRRWFSNQG